MTVWFENVLRLEDVWKLLYKARGWKFDGSRPMHITKNYGYYGKLGAVLFTLEGSPIKSYAVFVFGDPQGSMGSLHVYDSTGRKKKTVPAAILKGIDELEDSSIYPKPSRGFLLNQVQRRMYAEEVIMVTYDTKQRLWALRKINGFESFEEAVSFLLDFYEKATRRKLLMKELEVF